MDISCIILIHCKALGEKEAEAHCHVWVPHQREQRQAQQVLCLLCRGEKTAYICKVQANED